MRWLLVPIQQFLDVHKPSAVSNQPSLVFSPQSTVDTDG
jgi:hypothetical protein